MKTIYFEKEPGGTALIGGKVCEIKDDGSQVGSVNCQHCEFNRETNLEDDYVKCSNTSTTNS